MVFQSFAADEIFPDIQELMTEEELQTSGVGALSRDQINALNAWLQRYTSNEPIEPVIGEATVQTKPLQAVEIAVPVQPVATVIAPVVVEEPFDNFGRPRESVTMTSRIDGEFTGWTGRTQFFLENGQVWEQRRGRRWKIALDSPEVRITQNFMGAYEMEVVSEGRSIGVRRLR